QVLNPNWHRNRFWEEMGKLQFDFLVARGLKPEHYFLDVGCGSLRGGVHFIHYLEQGHYFGIDKNKEYLDAGRNIELVRYKLRNKKSILVQMNNFDFQSLNAKFDYALAQSVFTHLPLNNIIRAIINIEKVLVEGGQFYATFFENPQGKFNLDQVVHHPHGVITYFDKDPFHYNFKTFQWICEATNLKVEYIGDWKHPNDQMMMVFRRI
ncbi:unnamed protein product, partial [marine sediment metagenome]